MNPMIDVQETEPGIVQVTMQDTAGKNGLSEEFVRELHRVFQGINAHPSYKTVLLTGYGNYFCTGGTQEGLLTIQSGKLQFTDLKLHSLLLDCRIPVISVMQGHAIGAGFTIGLSSDFVILSRESFYSCNYMKYGFTPGMGATYIVPEKLGIVLGEEMLFTAANFSGAALEKRGVPFEVLPKKDALQRGRELARLLADKPRASLVALKTNVTARIKRELTKAVEEEVNMHEATFHLPEVKERISRLYGS
ncbi:polyketide synthase [Bacillus sp. SIMBA_031]|uniref:polyketide synthase n=1 Tax=Bacillus sp. SIMBA_031 TaxID=3085774 RepID=UPI00397DE98E